MLRPLRLRLGFRCTLLAHRLHDSMTWCGIAVCATVHYLGMVAQRLASAKNQSLCHPLCSTPAEHKPDECHPSA